MTMNRSLPSLRSDHLTRRPTGPGLEPNGANQNRGPESTLATLGALVALRSHPGSGVR